MPVLHYDVQVKRAQPSGVAALAAAGRSPGTTGMIGVTHEGGVL